MSGTTADKLNYLKDTKELLRQELNNDFSDLNLTASDPFRQYPSRISSSQLWMDTWIGGSVALDVTYDGTNNPGIFRNRYFNTLSIPNVTTNLADYHIVANTVIWGGPTSAGGTIVNQSNSIRNLYVNNLTKIAINGSFTNSAIANIEKLYLPSVTSLKGTTGMFGKITYALRSNIDIYLPKITDIAAFGIDGGNLHIGDVYCNLHADALTGIGAIYVPASKLDWYKSASGWSGYANRIFAEPGT